MLLCATLYNMAQTWDECRFSAVNSFRGIEQSCGDVHRPHSCNVLVMSVIIKFWLKYATPGPGEGPEFGEIAMQNKQIFTKLTHLLSPNPQFYTFLTRLGYAVGQKLRRTRRVMRRRLAAVTSAMTARAVSNAGMGEAAATPISARRGCHHMAAPVSMAMARTVTAALT